MGAVPRGRNKRAWRDYSKYITTHASSRPMNDHRTLRFQLEALAERQPLTLRLARRSVALLQHALGDHQLHREFYCLALVLGEPVVTVLFTQVDAHFLDESEGQH